MSQQEILVVDDDRNVLDQVRCDLKEERFSVRTAASVLEAVQRLGLDPRPEAMILDISLGRDFSAPGLPEDGLGLLKWVRKDLDIPVIMLSATRAESVKVLALNWGADDYVTKPFSPQELTARVKAVLRRGRPSAEDEYEGLKLGPLVIDSNRHEVFKHGEPIDLTLREFGVLEALAQAQGRVLSRGQIMDAAWGPGHYSVERTIDVHVRHLREKLEDDPANPKLILTVRGVGYRSGLVLESSVPRMQLTSAA
ncbi:MAG: response regulator transcription factor [bacterium]|nr:response regulator transcription factor [bacterium]